MVVCFVKKRVFFHLLDGLTLYNIKQFSAYKYFYLL